MVNHRLKKSHIGRPGKKVTRHNGRPGKKVTSYNGRPETKKSQVTMVDHIQGS